MQSPLPSSLPLPSPPLLRKKLISGVLFATDFNNVACLHEHRGQLEDIQQETADHYNHPGKWGMYSKEQILEGRRSEQEQGQDRYKNDWHGLGVSRQKNN